MSGFMIRIKVIFLYRAKIYLKRKEINFCWFQKLKETIGSSHCLKASERFNNPGQADIDIALIICKNYDDQYKSVKHGEQIIKQILFGVLYNVSFGVEYQKTALRIQTQRIVRIAKCFPDFCGLSDKLQHLLLKQNAFMMCFYTWLHCTQNWWKLTASSSSNSM